MAESVHLRNGLAEPLVARPDPFKDVHLPPGATQVNLLNVYYVHVRTRDGGDLYVTKFGFPYLEHLKLKNWREEEWFTRHREKLKGTSTVYRVPSRKVRGRRVNLVVKWNRVGEDVPLDTMTFATFADAEFNSPYEEFSLAIEMRERRHGLQIRTNRPLAIYVPPEQLKLWQTGRSKSKIARKKAKYRDVELDIARQYIVIYEWVKGTSADEALDEVIPDPVERRKELARITEKTRLDMKEKGFIVVDHKPAHVILRKGSNGTLLKRLGDYAYALVDFELLARTPVYEQEVETARRRQYLKHQQERFTAPKRTAFPKHLKPVTLFDVNYIWGSAESTRGALWVVGRDPDLFDYFLPERWRHTNRERLSKTNETFYTVSKDHINLVWKVSRVGEKLELNESVPNARTLNSYGYNSPFEEFSIALELAQKGFSTVYPRAIYMSGLESARSQDYVTDKSRYASHRHLAGPDGRLVLSPEHSFLTVWGYWRCLDEWPGSPKKPACIGINLIDAFRENLITQDRLDALLGRMREDLEAAGFEANLKPTHFLLSRRPDGSLRQDEQGEPFVTISNFELIRRIGNAT